VTVQPLPAWLRTLGPDAVHVELYHGAFLYTALHHQLGIKTTRATIAPYLGCDKGIAPDANEDACATGLHLGPRRCRRPIDLHGPIERMRESGQLLSVN